MSKGLYRRYYIRKVDGSDIDQDAEYFVLRLDSDADYAHRYASICAAMAYADAIRPSNPQLASDLMMRYGPLPKAPQQEDD